MSSETALEMSCTPTNTCKESKVETNTLPNMLLLFLQCNVLQPIKHDINLDGGWFLFIIGVTVEGAVGRSEDVADC